MHSQFVALRSIELNRFIFWMQTKIQNMIERYIVPDLSAPLAIGSVIIWRISKIITYVNQSSGNADRDLTPNQVCFDVVLIKCDKTNS